MIVIQRTKVGYNIIYSINKKIKKLLAVSDSGSVFWGFNA